MNSQQIIDAIHSLAETQQIEKSTIESIIESEDLDVANALFSCARDIREKYFGKKIFLYGFVYFSTYCRNNCSFCFYRRDNRDTIRYRKNNQEIFEVAKGLVESGVQLIDLTLGEDPILHKEHFESMLQLVRKIRTELGVPVMISPGVIDDDLIVKFADLGTEFYALYQETYNRNLFGKLRLEQNFDKRLHAKIKARDLGIHIEEGLMTGLGETTSDLADALLQMQQLGATQLRVMTFVPQAGTPMENFIPENHDTECKIIALLRLMNHRILIPASLDVEGIEGLESRINAGCNVVTSIIPPTSGMAGVAQSTKDVSEGYRTVHGVTPRLNSMGLSVATVEDLKEFLAI